MQLYYDGDKAKELNGKLFEYFNSTAQNRDSVHLSDTVHCEMKCYNRLVGLPYTIDSKSAARMLFGQIGQELLQVLYPPEQREYSVEGEIPLHIDIFEDNKYPIEIKWSAQKIYRAGDIPKGWMLQLMGYMALTESLIGWMVIVNVLDRQVSTFKLTMAPEEWKEQKERIKASRERIMEAVAKKDPMILCIEESECYWCDFKPNRNKKKDNIESCSRYVPKKSMDEDQPLSAS